MKIKDILKQKNSVIIGLFLTFLILITFLPRIFDLSLHWAADENLWMKRSRDFFLALEKGQFEDTFTAYHPGVTTCWLGSFAIWLTPQEQLHSRQFFSPEMLSRIRFPIAYLTGVLVLVIGMVLYRLLGGLLACVGTLFIAIEPFLLSESRRAHTDVLTALFLFLTLLLWIRYLEDTTYCRRSLVFSGICFSLACLTKSHASAFLIFLPIMLLWYERQLHLSWKRLILSGLLWIAVVLITVLVVWPYMWTITYGKIHLFPLLFFTSCTLLLWSWKKLSNSTSLTFSRIEIFLLGSGLLIIAGLSFYAVDLVISKMYEALTSAHNVQTRFLGSIRYNPGPLFFPVMWFVWTGLLTFPLAVFSICRTWQMRQREQKIFRVAVVLLIFVVFYFIGLSCVSKKISRYLIIFLPAVSILTAIGTVQFALLWKRKWINYLVLLFIFLLQVTPILRLHPYYRVYYYPLLSGKWIAENTSSITGAGLDIAAAYLNSKPNAQNTRVRLTWFCKDLAHYFVGKTTSRYNSVTSPPNFDYDVEYLYDKQIQGDPVDTHPNPEKLITTYEHKVPREIEHVVNLNGVDYVWIYRVIKREPTDKIDAPPQVFEPEK